MFSKAEMQLIIANKNCLLKFEELLANLSISVPDWSGDEYRRDYEKLDNDITKEICKLMNSETIIDGYTKLLKTGSIPYDYSESYNLLLDMVVMNKDKILSAIRNQEEARTSWEKKYSRAPKTKTVEKLKVEATDLKPFDKSKLTSKFNKIKKDYYSRFLSSACEAVEECINEVEKLNTLFEVNGKSFYYETVEDFIREINKLLQAGESCNVRLKITKVFEEHKADIPPEPQESFFTLQEAEKALDVLAQVREIIRLEG